MVVEFSHVVQSAISWMPPAFRFSHAKLFDEWGRVTIVHWEFVRKVHKVRCTHLAKEMFCYIVLILLQPRLYGCRKMSFLEILEFALFLYHTSYVRGKWGTKRSDFSSFYFTLVMINLVSSIYQVDELQSAHHSFEMLKETNVAKSQTSLTCISGLRERRCIMI